MLYISGNGGAGDIAPSPSCMARAIDSVVELVTLSKTTVLGACIYQTACLLVLVNWFCDLLGIRFFF